MVSVVQLPADVSCPQERMKKGDVVERRCKALKEHGFLNYFGPQRLGEDLWLVDETLPETKHVICFAKKKSEEYLPFSKVGYTSVPWRGPACHSMTR